MAAVSCLPPDCFGTETGCNEQSCQGKSVEVAAEAVVDLKPLQDHCSHVTWSQK